MNDIGGEHNCLIGRYLRAMQKIPSQLAQCKLPFTGMVTSHNLQLSLLETSFPIFQICLQTWEEGNLKDGNIKT